jgi:hypothetical protein
METRDRSPMSRQPRPFILEAMERKVDEMRIMTSNTLVSVDARWKPC